MLTRRGRERRFMATFRMSPASFFAFEKILNENTRKKTHGWNQRIEMLVFLYWICQGVSYTVCARSFKIAESTIYDIVRKYLHKVSALAKVMVKVPESRDELARIAKAFERRAGTRVLSGCVGTIDGTLINIKAPKQNPEDYIDRKCGYSMNLTTICDDRGYIIWAITGYPGSVHDSRVFMESTFFKKAKYPPQPYYIVGDSAYRCLESPIRLLPVIRPYRSK